MNRTAAGASAARATTASRSATEDISAGKTSMKTGSGRPRRRFRRRNSSAHTLASKVLPRPAGPRSLRPEPAQVIRHGLDLDRQHISDPGLQQVVLERPGFTRLEIDGRCRRGRLILLLARHLRRHGGHVRGVLGPAGVLPVLNLAILFRKGPIVARLQDRQDGSFIGCQLSPRDSGSAFVSRTVSAWAPMSIRPKTAWKQRITSQSMTRATTNMATKPRAASILVLLQLRDLRGIQRDKRHLVRVRCSTTPGILHAGGWRRQAPVARGQGRVQVGRGLLHGVSLQD